MVPKRQSLTSLRLGHLSHTPFFCFLRGVSESVQASLEVILPCVSSIKVLSDIYYWNKRAEEEEEEEEESVLLLSNSVIGSLGVSPIQDKSTSTLNLEAACGESLPIFSGSP